MEGNLFVQVALFGLVLAPQALQKWLLPAPPVPQKRGRASPGLLPPPLRSRILGRRVALIGSLPRRLQRCLGRGARTRDERR